MKVVAMISTKGGTAKTSTTVGLAVEAMLDGKQVAVADIDQQASSMGWADRRQRAFPRRDEPTVVSLQPSRLRLFLDKARDSGADLVVIDTAPSADTAIVAAEAADFILVPCRCSIVDLEAIEMTARIIRHTGKPGAALLTCVPHRAPLIVADAKEAVEHWHLKVAPVLIHQRSAYVKAMITGQSVSEFEPNGKAADEIAALYKWVKKQVH
jgi:chromosome partitioning protein